MNVNSKTKWKKRFNASMISLSRGVLVFGLCFIVLYPLYTRLVESVMTVADVYDSGVNYIPKNFTWDNFKEAAKILVFPRSLWQSVLLVSVVSLVQTFSCTVVAYGFARFKFKFNKPLFLVVVLMMMIPPDMLLAPYFLEFRSFDPFGLFTLFGIDPPVLLDSYWPFILLGLTCTGLKNGLYIFIMRQYFSGIPKELEEAAYVDGAGAIRTLFRIIMPGATAMMVTVFLFSFVWQWLDGIYTPVFCGAMDVIPSKISILANPFSNMENVDVNYMLSGALIQNAGIVLIISPLMLLYLFTQKFFVQSMERSGLVG